jgi:hypothetical protein
MVTSNVVKWLLGVLGLVAGSEERPGFNWMR